MAVGKPVSTARLTISILRPLQFVPVEEKSQSIRLRRISALADKSSQRILSA